MPKLDGTGPDGQGALTGKGEGDCTTAYPLEEVPYSDKGLQRAPTAETKPQEIIPEIRVLPNSQQSSTPEKYNQTGRANQQGQRNQQRQRGRHGHH